MTRSKETIEYHRLTDAGKEALRKDYLLRAIAQSDSVGRGALDDFAEKRVTVLEQVIYERNILFSEGQREDLMKFFQPAFDHLNEYHKGNLKKRQDDIDLWENKRKGTVQAQKTP